jgi:hypothetical protein
MNKYQFSAVIIDSRITDLFEVVLNNFYSKLDERWCFIIMTTNNNFNYLKDLIYRNFNKEKKRTTIIKFNINHISFDNYQQLFYYESFYSHITTELFLIFQLDSLLSDKYHHQIYDFMNYDYIGSPFYKNDNEYYYVGCGGLSLRKKSKMIEIVNDINYNNENNRKLPEDLFFCEYPFINKAPSNVALKFCSGLYFHPESIGMHRTFDFITQEQLNTIETHFPLIRIVEYKYKNLPRFTSKNDDIIKININSIIKSAVVYHYNYDYLSYSTIIITIIAVIIIIIIFYIFQYTL